MKQFYCDINLYCTAPFTVGEQIITNVDVVKCDMIIIHVPFTVAIYVLEILYKRLSEKIKERDAKTILFYIF